MPLTWRGATRPQVIAIIGHIKDAVQKPEGWTHYDTVRKVGEAADRNQKLGPAMIAHILGNLSVATNAMGYGFVSALVRRKEDNMVGEGFWTYFGKYHHLKVDPLDRENWLDEQTKFLHERATDVVRVLDFVSDEVNRSQ